MFPRRLLEGVVSWGGRKLLHSSLFFEPPVEAGLE
jgi:hypothetical protein